MANETVRELLAKAMTRREELRLESEALDSLIQTYSGLMHLKTEPESPQLNLLEAQRSRRARSVYVAGLMDEIRKMILTEGRPLTRRDLLKRLEAQGYVIEGGDKSKVLGTNIWRSKLFVHIEGKGYWPKDVAPMR
jgi:reverse gyrase